MGHVSSGTFLGWAVAWTWLTCGAAISMTAAAEPGFRTPSLDEPTLVQPMPVQAWHPAEPWLAAEPTAIEPEMAAGQWYEQHRPASASVVYQPSEVDDVLDPMPAEPEIFDNYVRQRVRREFSPRGPRRDPLPSSLLISPHARIPGYGVLGDVLETGYGVGLHAFFPLSRAIYASDRSAWFYGIETGFDYTYFEGKKGVNVNVPGGVDSVVHNADMYLFDLGMALCNARLVGDSNLVWFNSVALKGVIGGIAADMAANEFDPLDKQVAARSPREDAFLRGGRLEWKSGLLLPNGYTLSAFGSGDFHSTSAVVGHNQRTGFWTVGASLEIPTMPLRRAMSTNAGRGTGTLLLGW